MKNPSRSEPGLYSSEDTMQTERMSLEVPDPAKQPGSAVHPRGTRCLLFFLVPNLKSRARTLTSRLSSLSELCGKIDTQPYRAKQLAEALYRGWSRRSERIGSSATPIMSSRAFGRTIMGKTVTQVMRASGWPPARVSDIPSLPPARHFHCRGRAARRRPPTCARCRETWILRATGVPLAR